MPDSRRSIIKHHYLNLYFGNGRIICPVLLPFSLPAAQIFRDFGNGGLLAVSSLPFPVPAALILRDFGNGGLFAASSLPFPLPRPRFSRILVMTTSSVQSQVQICV